MALGGIVMLALFALAGAPNPSSASADGPSSLTAVVVESTRPAAKGRLVMPDRPELPVADPVLSSPQRKGAAALQLISYPWQDLDYDLVFLPAADGLRGLTFPYERRIEIYVRSSDTPQSLAHVVAHEIGHAVDVSLNSGPGRVQWLQARGLEADYRWWPESGQSDFATGAGDFAECFAVWQVDARSYSEIDADCADDLDLLQALAMPEPSTAP